MKNKVLSLMTAVCVLVGSIVPINVFANKTELKTGERAAAAPVGDEVLLSIDFSDKYEGLTMEGTGKIVELDGDYVLDWTGVETKSFGVYNKEVLPRGRYCISYDFYAETTEHLQSIRVLAQDARSMKDEKYQVFRFNKDGNTRIALSATSTSWAAYDYNLFGEWEGGKWHSFAVWVDLDLREVEYWVDGIRTQRHRLMDEIQDIKGFCVAKAGADVESEYYLDNIKFTKDSDGKSSGFDPLYIGCKPTNDEVVGNNFYTDMLPSFDLSFINRTNETIDAEISWKTVNFSNFEVWKSKPMNISVKPGEPLERTITVDGEPHYGVLDLIMDIKVGDTHYEKVIPYSLSNFSWDLPNNHRSGVQAHIVNGPSYGSVEDNLYLLKRAGIGGLRDGYVHWQYCEPEDGVFVIDEDGFGNKYDEMLDLFKEYDIRLVNTFRGSSNHVLPGESGSYPPSTPEDLAAMEKWMKTLAEFADGRIYAYEVFNEYNNSSFTGSHSTDYNNFAQMHKAMWNGVKSADPDALVAGLAEDNWSLLGSPAVSNYLENMDSQWFDAVATHPYVPSGQAPEYGITAKLKDSMESLLERYNFKSDLPRLGTEWGWSLENTDYNEERKGVYYPRAMQMTLFEDSLDVIYWYCFCLNGKQFNDKTADDWHEGTFGMMQAGSDDAAVNPLLANPVYVMAAYYNKLMANAEPVKNYTDSDVFSYHTRSANGSDVLMLGTINGDAHTRSYYLGTKSVTVGDSYGNEHTLYSDSGVYDFLLGADTITYVQGKFSNVRDVTDTKTNFQASDVERYIPVNCGLDLSVTSSEGFDGTLTLKDVQGLEIEVAEAKFKGGKATVRVRSLENPVDTARATLVAKKGDKIYYEGLVRVFYDKSGIIIDPKWQMSPERVDLWNYSFDVKNVRTDKSITGEVEVDGIARGFYLPPIAPGETREVVIPMNILNVEDLGTVNLDVNFSSGESTSLSQSDYMTVVEYTETPPKIDGYLSEGEYEENFFTLKLNRADQAYYQVIPTAGIAWSGEDDCSAKFYLKYDLDNFYFSAEVTDDVHDADYPVNAMWKGDSLQVLVVFDPTAPKGTQYGVGLADGTRPAIYRNSQEGNTTGYVGTAATGEYLDGEVAVRREGTKTYYEAKFPWDKIEYAEGRTVERGEILYFSVLVNDSDGRLVTKDIRRKLWMEYGLSNIGAGPSAPQDALRMILE